MKRLAGLIAIVAAATCLLVVVWAGKAPAVAEQATLRSAALEPDCDPEALPRELATACRRARLREGRRLFDHEEFGGIGRTCATCHSGRDGTIDPLEVALRLQGDPGDALFLHDGLDDFVGGTSRIEAHATILVRRELPRGVTLTHDPTASSVVVMERLRAAVLKRGKVEDLGPPGTWAEAKKKPQAA